MENKVILGRGQSENLQKIASGEFPLFCGVNYHSALRIIDQGAPINFVFPDPLPLEFGGQIHIGKWSQTPATTQPVIMWDLWDSGKAGQTTAIGVLLITALTVLTVGGRWLVSRLSRQEEA